MQILPMTGSLSTFTPGSYQMIFLENTKITPTGFIVSGFDLQ